MFSHPIPLARFGQALLVAAVVLVTWMQQVETGLDPVYAPISFYARSRHGWMLFAALLVMAAATLAISRAYRLLEPANRGSRPLRWLSLILVLVAVLRAQAYFPWEGPPTVEGLVHFFAGAIGFLLFAWASFTVSRESRRWSLLAITFVFIALSGFTATRAGVLLLLGGRPETLGLEERLILLIAVAWFFVLFPFFGKHKTSLGSAPNQA